MPGVVTMESSGHNGTRTDHDRDSDMNGVTGATNNLDGEKTTAPVKEKQGATGHGDDTHESATNGKDASRPADSHADEGSSQTQNRMNNLPDEIIHITQGFVPLSLLLTRLAQTTHNALQDKVAELAKMPVPASAVNGNSSSYSSSGPDDTSVENLRKKGNLTNFAQDMHGKWLKALVIAEWSRKSELVSKLIDLKFHIDQQRMLYDGALDNIVNVKRDLTFARMPSPDLKTALQVLSTGTAPWMPDLQYIEPPALTPKDQLKWMNDLNTLLSLRLNLEDYDKIPRQFRNYEISSGRVTFKVNGEFEVDLTIADEDFEKQFWFIDFRYAFAPAASSLPESLRAYLEGCVNDVLGKEGLTGCYQFLHEFVLTSKINELKRQALQLSRSSWTGTLAVEPLNRALAIQYWVARSTTTGSKSWVLIATNSNRKPNGKEDSKTTSQLVVKWFRDNKEVKDNTIEMDVNNLSAESLLNDVIGRHIEYILTNIHDKLLTAARFKSREASMSLRLSKSDPAFSVLTTQVGYGEKASMLLEPMTGVFAVKPQSKFTIQPEHQLNNGKNPADDGVVCLEQVRCAVMEDELHRRGSSMGWHMRKSPMTTEELRSATKTREWTRAIWLQKDGWGSRWFVVVILSLSGDEWWLLDSHRNETSKGSRFQARLPLNNGFPNLSDVFWNNLVFFTTGIIAQSVDMREFHRQRIKSRSNDKPNLSLPQQIRLPSIDVALSALFPGMVFDKVKGKSEKSADSGEIASTSDDILSIMQRASGVGISPKQAWAENIVTVSFRSIQSLSKVAPADGANDESARESELICISDATLKVRRPSKFASLKDLADRDVSYNPERGEFSLRIQRPVNTPILSALKSRVKAIDRFVNFLESMDSAKGTIRTESVTLRRVAFYYGAKEPKASTDGKGDDQNPEKPEKTQPPPKQWRMVLDLSKDDIEIEVEKGNPHLRVLDLMRRLANSEGGIGALMTWLPASLSALQAIDKMETEWESIQAAGKGRLEFSMKTIAWMTLGYSFGAEPGTRLSLEVKMKPRRGEPWWHVWRSDANTNSDDAVSKVLKPIWDGKGQQWFGLATGAAGRPNGGVVGMLLAVDEAIRTAVDSGAISGDATSGSKGNSNEVVVLE